MSKVRRKIKRSEFFDETCGFRWVLTIGGTQGEAILWLCKKFNLPSPPPKDLEDTGNAGSFINNSSELYLCAIWLREESGISTWTHECTHGALHVTQTLGIDPFTGEEFVATYAGYLMKQLCRLDKKK